MTEHLPETTIHIGGVYASRDPALVKTILGSCISACLFDPQSGVGGMNHYLLPEPPRHSSDESMPSRFGIHAMDLLIGAIQKLGGRRDRIQAKVFGGAHVLAMKESATGVPQRNIAFIEEFMREEGIPIVARDLGGYLPRRVMFQTHSGRAFVQRMGTRTLALTRLEEQQIARTAPPPQFGDITLFGDD